MAGGMVMIACKAPNGIVLDLDRYEVLNIEKGIIRTHKGPMPPVTLKGWAAPFGQPPGTVGGYGLTAVPADFWEAWFSVNANSPLLADKIILPPHKDTHAQAKDHAEVPQMFRPAREGDVPGVKRDDAKAA